MKSIRIGVIALIVSAIPMLACAEKFRVNINYLVFHLSEDTSYVEMQFLFLGNGLIYKQNASGLHQATTGVKIQFTNEKTAQVINGQYSFSSNAYKDTSSAKENSMYNLVRILLPQGTYRMQITAFDANDSVTAPLIHKDEVKIDFDRKKVCFSDIQTFSDLTVAKEESYFSKYGYDYTPYFSTFYPENIAKLLYSVEIYNLDKEDSEKKFYAVSYIVQDGVNGTILDAFQQEKKLQNSIQNIVIQSFPIDSLPSGNYNLVIDVKDEQGVLYGRKSMFFQRSNPSVVFVNTARIDDLPFDTLKQYLDYIYPIATKEERYFISQVRLSDYAAIGDFFQNFWYKRNSNNPQEEWFKYYKRVLQVNKNYSTWGRVDGYKTDRGYYYLKYGPPNYIEYYPSEVNSFPFEIWTYYDFAATGRSSVYFVFYEKDLVSKDYRLLHSNASSELYNPRWKQILQTDIDMPDDYQMQRDDYPNRESHYTTDEYGF